MSLTCHTQAFARQLQHAPTCTGGAASVVPYQGQHASIAFDHVHSPDARLVAVRWLIGRVQGGTPPVVVGLIHSFNYTCARQAQQTQLGTNRSNQLSPIVVGLLYSFPWLRANAFAVLPMRLLFHHHSFHSFIHTCARQAQQTRILDSILCLAV